MQTVWLIRGGPGGLVAPAFVEHGLVALGWYGVLGDLRRLSRWELVERLEGVSGTADQDADELIDFRDQVASGHYVVTPDGGTRDIVVGQIASPYDYRPDSPVVDDEAPLPHVRQVTWWGRGSRDDLPADLRKELNGRRPVRRLPAPGSWARIVEELRDGPLGPGPRPAAVRAARPRPVASPGTPRVRASRAAAPKPPPASVGRVCPGCQLRRPDHQFVADVPWCADCRADLL